MKTAMKTRIHRKSPLQPYTSGFLRYQKVRFHAVQVELIRSNIYIYLYKNVCKINFATKNFYVYL